MIDFEQFFYEHTNPHHRRTSRILHRGTDPNEKGLNLVANRYKKGDSNYKEQIQLGPIGGKSLKDLVDKFNINIAKLNNSKDGVRLRKRPYKVRRTKTGYTIEKI